MNNITLNTSLRPAKRVHYSRGMVLGVDEFRQEQAYFLARGRSHNQFLHGFGTVCGLQVFHRAADTDIEIGVTPGMAIDLLGREILLPGPQPHCARLITWLKRPDHAAAVHALLDEANGDPLPIYVVLCYKEQATDPQLQHRGPCDFETEAFLPSRYEDGFELKFSLHRPYNPDYEKRLGHLFRHIRYAEESNPFNLTEEAFLALVRKLGDVEALPDLTQDALSALVHASDDIDVAQAEDGEIILHVPARDATVWMEKAYRIWVTEICPAFKSKRDAQLENDQGKACVLLATVNGIIERGAANNIIGFAKDAHDEPQLTIDEHERPILLNSRLIQYTGAIGGGNGRSVIHDDLTHIVAQSWPHDKAYGFDLKSGNSRRTVKGIAIAFGKSTDPDDPGGLLFDEFDEDTFQVFLEDPSPAARRSLKGFSRRIRIAPMSITAYKNFELDGTGRITRVKHRITPVSASREGGTDAPRVAKALLFQFSNENLTELYNHRIWVAVNGNHMLDERGEHMIAARFLPNQTLQEDVAMIPGGEYKSWFILQNNLQALYNINTDSRDDLLKAKFIGNAIADQIVKFRGYEVYDPPLSGYMQHFKRLSQLLALRGISSDWLKKHRSKLTLELPASY